MSAATRGRLPAYLRYQLGDYLLQRAVLPLVLVLFIAGLPLYATLRQQPEFFDQTRGALFARQLFTNTVTVFLPIGVFLAVTGVLSTDRQHGHFRFYFSKPVGVLAYYAQTYLLHGLCFVALFGGITWAFGALSVHQSVGGALKAAALTFVLVGGLGFLLGALTRFDGGLLVIVYLFTMTLQDLVARAVPALPPWWAVQLARALPPIHTMDELRTRLYNNEAIAAGPLWHVLGYGAGAFALGFVALRRLPLSR